MSTLLPNIAWRHQAACRQPGMADIFYPPPELEKKHIRLEREKVAKAICEACPVCAECLDHALMYEETQGVWGGKSESELRAIIKERNNN